jgi:hypothetical protein
MGVGNNDLFGRMWLLMGYAIGFASLAGVANLVKIITVNQHNASLLHLAPLKEHRKKNYMQANV